jgi:acetyltransferase-like isoleucine patch superfamily enzyme
MDNPMLHADGNSAKRRRRGFLAYLLALPFITLVWRKPRDFVAVAEAVSIIPFSIGKKIRNQFYGHTLKRMGDNVTFSFGTVLNYKDAAIGNNVSFNRNCNIGNVVIGDNVLFASGVVVLSGRHTHLFDDTTTPINKQKSARRTNTIGNDVWIGSNAIIMEPVADGCVIGAGSVVTRPTAPYSVCAGNPARTIRKRGEGKVGR